MATSREMLAAARKVERTYGADAVRAMSRAEYAAAIREALASK